MHNTKYPTLDAWVK